MFDKENEFNLPLSELLAKSYLIMTQFPKSTTIKYKTSNYSIQNFNDLTQINMQNIKKKPLGPRHVLNNYVRQQDGNNLSQKQSHELKLKEKKLIKSKNEEQQSKEQSDLFNYQKHFKYQLKTQSQMKNTNKISTSRALLLYSKILKSKNSQSTIIQRKKIAHKNGSFNIKRMHIKDKLQFQRQKQQKRIQQKINRCEKSREIKTSTNQTQGHRYFIRSKMGKKLKNESENFQIDPWETFLQFET